MLDVHNRTPLVVAVMPWLDKDGADHACVVIKGTFAVGIDRKTRLADEQAPIERADTYAGIPGQSGLLYAAESCPPKLGTDVALLGNAYAPRAGVPSVDVRLRVGPLRKDVRVFGDRRFFRHVGSWEISDPAPFDRVPLTWERAYGGRDASLPAPDRHETEWRNPVGTGFAPSGSKERIEGLALPNLEDPRELINSPRIRPAPAGFGFTAPSWLPRRLFAGTYDDRWMNERRPYLPADFDDRFFSAAATGLLATPHLRGGEPVEIVGATRSGPLLFALPTARLAVRVVLSAHPTDHVPVLDTVVVEPDRPRVLLTWKVSVPCHRQFLSIERIYVTGEALP